MTKKLSFEEINDLVDDNVSETNCRSYLERLLTHHQQSEFYTLIQVQNCIRSSRLATSSNSVDHITHEKLFKIDVSHAVMSDIQQIGTHRKDLAKKIDDGIIENEISNKKPKKNNVISLIFGQSKLKLALAASVLLVTFNMSYFLQQQTSNPLEQITVTEENSSHDIDLHIQQKLVAQEIEEQNRNLQETLLKHRLLQQGFFPSELVSNDIAEVAESIQWEAPIETHVKDEVFINYYYQTNATPIVSKVKDGNSNY